MQALFKWLTPLLLVTVLAGCATAYQQRGLTGGYSEKKLDDNRYFVFFDGNGKTSQDRVWYFWIYRCAQLTREQGYEYFSLTPVQDASSKATSFDPSQGGRLYPAVLTGDANGHLINVHATGGSFHVIAVPGGVGTITSWHSRAVVTMYRASDVPSLTFVLRAKSVMDLLADYIRSEGASVPPPRKAINDQAMYAVAPDQQLVNVHDYLATHVAAPATASPAYPVAAAALPQPYAAAPRSAAHAQATALPAESPASSVPPATTALGEVTAALNAQPGAAQSVATGLGCGAAKMGADGNYVAPCNDYSVVIHCDGDHCHPMHTINVKSDDE